jgi:hypothetical protein
MFHKRSFPQVSAKLSENASFSGERTKNYLRFKNIPWEKFFPVLGRKQTALS